MKQRAAIYARQSLDKTEGIDRQRHRCEALIESREWAVAETYVDNDTSASKARGAGTAWAKLLDDIENRRIDVVVAVDLDRLLRSTSDLVKLIELGATVVTVDGELDLSSADGEFRATMLAGIARFEVRRKAERQLRANVRRTETGRPVPGRRRFGFESDGVTIRESEAVHVRWAFEQFSTGASLRSISQEFTRNVDPAPGKAWTPRRVRDMLSMPAYWGAVRYRGEVLPGDGLPEVVPPELAARVASILTDEARRTTPGPSVKHLLSGIARCGVCGETLFYMRTYRCRDASHPSITKDRLEPQVRDWIAANMRNLMRERPVGDAADTAALRAKRADLAERRSRAQQMAEDPDFDMLDARRRVRTLSREIEDLDAQIEQAEVSTAKLGVIELFARRRDMALDFWSNGAMKTTSLAGLPVLDMKAYAAAERELADDFRTLWTTSTAVETSDGPRREISIVHPQQFDELRRFLRAMVLITVNPARGDAPRIVFRPTATLGQEPIA